ncbi:hypothetical protein POM88_036472 [Heracleum sosnowskyi]|uniref:RING-type E3 ubiquitin transferase n=1 Tax=Heracleum sosnowskyi TaxID=360622 RepID=A0AAD8MCE2_9APIA|nr:hypothetical protein POM88_036472 [Heracleum sosnowskyi]
MDFQVRVSLLWAILVCVIRVVLAEKSEAAGDECRIMRCSHHGPEIRFPFQLKDLQAKHCGHPGFGVYCHKGKTLLDFQYLANTSLQGTKLILSKEVFVCSINYKSQEIVIYNSQFTNNLKLVSKSNSFPFELSPSFLSAMRPYSTATFVSCSLRNEGELGFPPEMLTSLGGQDFPVYTFDHLIFTSKPSITSCTKVFNSSLPLFLLEEYSHIIIKWSTPNCVKCEAKGEYCKPMKNITSSNIKTADHSIKCLSRGQSQGSIKPTAGRIIATMPPNPFRSSIARSFTNDLEVISESE